MLVSNKILSSENKHYKYFICYFLHNDHKFKPLHIVLKSYDGQNIWMYFMIENNDLLEKYNTIWEKSALISKNNLVASLSTIKDFLKIKIKSHGDEVTKFYDKEIAKVDSNHTYLAVISLDSALKKFENCYPQRLLKECKYIEKNIISNQAYY